MHTHAVTIGMYERFNQYTLTRPRIRRFFGWVLVVIGFFALVTPLTPGGFLFFVGLEILGIRIIGFQRIRDFFQKNKSSAEESV